MDPARAVKQPNTSVLGLAQDRFKSNSSQLVFSSKLQRDRVIQLVSS